MKAMILAAGLGTRLRPLTNKTPKPLITVNDIPLLQYHIEKLVFAGVTEIVINHAWLGEQIVEFVGDGSAFGCRIRCSEEIEPLETAGGIIKALPLLGDQPFIVVNGDIWSEFDYGKLLGVELGQSLAHLVLTENPEHNPDGDFSLQEGMICARQAGKEAEAENYTFAGISVLSPELFAGIEPGKRPLKPLLDKAIASQRVTGEMLDGYWCDVGTLERLESLRQHLRPA